jgi:lipoprotein-anchoring transpeptidase ErfK/SrfK
MRRRALLGMIATIVLVACGGASPSVPASAPPSPTEAPTAWSSSSAAPADVASPSSSVRHVASTSADVFLVYAEAGVGAPQQVAARNDWHQPIALPVIHAARADDERWLHVRLPTRPNGSTGWVRARDVRIKPVHERIVVDLSRHLLERIRDGAVVQRIRVGVGTATYPTTPGRFFVWARLTYHPPGAYGVGALGLSGFSRVITDWVGGGRMAIHGTGNPTDRGHDVSHGCVRVFNPQMARLADVAMGTQVLIRP